MIKHASESYGFPSSSPARFGASLLTVNTRAADYRLDPDSPAAETAEVVIGAPNAESASGDANAGAVNFYRTTVGQLVVQESVEEGSAPDQRLGTSLAHAYGQDSVWQDVLIGVPGSGGGDNGLTLVTKATEVLPCAGVTGIWQTQDGRGSSHPDAERIGVLTVDSYVDGSGTTQPAQTWVQFLDEFHMRVEDNTGGACTFEDPDGVVHTGPLIIPPGGRFRLLDVATSTSTVCSGVSTFPDSDFTELGASVSLHPSPGTAPVYTGLQFPVAVTGGGARIDLILDMSTLDFSEAKMDASCRIIGTGGLRGGLFELTNRTDICED